MKRTTPLAWRERLHVAGIVDLAEAMAMTVILAGADRGTGLCDVAGVLTIMVLDPGHRLPRRLAAIGWFALAPALRGVLVTGVTELGQMAVDRPGRLTRRRSRGSSAA